MIKEKIDYIRATEDEAAKILAEADRESASIIAQAEALAGEIEQRAKEEAEKQAVAVRAEKMAEVNRAVESVSQDGQEKVEALNRRLAGRIESVAETLVALVIEGKAD